MATIIPIASPEKFDSISPVRSNGQAINLERQYCDGVGDDGDPLQSFRLKRRNESCANSTTTTTPSHYGGSGGGGSSSSASAIADEDARAGAAPPHEASKTALCLALLLLVLAGNLLSIAAIHDRAPATREDANQSYPPLRDVTFDAAETLADKMMAAPRRNYEYALLLGAETATVATSVYVVCAVCALHPHRSVVLRRLCFLLAVLFGLRLLTMNVTTLPVSGAALYRCAPKERRLALGVVASRFFELAAGAGLSAAAGDDYIRYCGNYVFSGHAVLLVLNCLWADEYGRRSARRRLLHAAMKVVAAGSLAALVVAGFDYTISVLTAYYATTRVFWIYHTMANNAPLKRPDPANKVCHEWWYPLFRYLEGNVRGIVATPKFH